MLKLTIRQMLIIGFSIIVGLLVISSIIAINKLSGMNSRIDTIVDGSAMKIKLGARLNQGVIAVQRAEKNIILAKSQQDMNEYIENIASIRNDMQSRRAQLRELVDENGQRYLDEFAEVWEKYLGVNQQVIDFALSLQNQDAFSLSSNQGRELNDKASELIAKIVDVNEKGLELDQQISTDNYKTARLILVISLVISSVLAIGIAVFIIRRLRIGISEVSKVTTAIANGELNNRINNSGHDELSDILRSLATMQRKLKETINNIEHCATELVDTSEHLNATVENTLTNIELAQQNTVQVATAVEEMSATVNTVAQDINHTALTAKTVNDQAVETKNSVSNTGNTIDNLATQVNTSSEVVGQVRERSNDINTVLEVIRSVAEQTNLLALNAAIEAARAGDHGRGFSVVADEVRNLAARTQESTEEINTIISSLQTSAHEAVEVINQSTDEAREAVEQMNTAEEALQSITQSVDKISDMSSQIATAAEQQSVVTDQINQNVVTITEMSHSNVESAHETKKASKKLRQVTGNLRQLVNVFQT
ncbi:methyl-accepting chemotaxis protein [Aestuariibacter sp. AA17]|uniref:Methyl-accepting chemotaxis protein n=1 Tax=Fluctibacter corallii TaxID=2984329 RepID=A0ABT3ACD2_9ALTE|nr:methyl-accepting chemotaxis protein [Aestuariibacter sp. AA17]MCV2886341.1 methyl-accepting chemotaxis protein [Aestuariibacter sp. AA17]